MFLSVKIYFVDFVAGKLDFVKSFFSEHLVCLLVMHKR